MRKSIRYDLKPFDYDENLVKAQMAIRLVEGIGFSGYREDAILDPGDVFLTNIPGQISRRVDLEHQEALMRK
jgi:hypothetical protein